MEQPVSAKNLHLLLSGLAAGDSLGSTSEFVPFDGISIVYEQHRRQGWPFKQVGGGTFHWQAGQPTDDTDMAMCLVRSFKALGRFDGQDVAKGFVGWMKGNPPDIGGTTMNSLGAVSDGTPWHEGGLDQFLNRPDHDANGSIMRNGVVVGMASSLDDAFRISLSHGAITHYAPVPQLCCAAQTFLIWRLLEGWKPSGQDWLAEFRQAFERWLSGTTDNVCGYWRERCQHHLPKAWDVTLQAEWDADRFNPFQVDLPRHQGSALLTLQVASWALNWSLRDEPFPCPKGFPQEIFSRRGPWVLGWVAMIGRDSDTYGAATGPLIAAAHGELPAEMVEGLWVLKDNSA